MSEGELLTLLLRTVLVGCSRFLHLHTVETGGGRWVRVVPVTPLNASPRGPRVKAEQRAFVRSLLSLVLVSYVLEREKHCFPFSSAFVWVCMKETDDAALLG